jgi:L,D-transpeptidase ErfK/SrfK
MGTFTILWLLVSSAMNPVPTLDAVAPIVGEERLYRVRRGDSLAGLAARFGVDPDVLAERNGLSERATLRVGQTLKIDNRHVVPGVLEDGILINVPQRLLFYFELGRLVSWYPVGLGRADWQTPIGSFYIATKEEKPVWDVPRSIQDEMRREGRRVREKVPPGPANPLGEYWIGLNANSCGIHGTNAPTSVYRLETHGCIRLHPDDVADLYSRVGIGTPVEVVYRPILVTRLDDGAFFVESHPDAYGREGDPASTVDPLVELPPEVRTAAREVIARRAGIATRIPPAEPAIQPSTSTGR